MKNVLPKATPIRWNPSIFPAYLGKVSFEYPLYQAYSACQRRMRAAGSVAHKSAFDL